MKKSWSAAIIVGSIVATAGGLMINLMPLTIGLTAEKYLLEHSQLGWLASAMLFGSFVVTASAIWWVNNVRWPHAIVFSATAAALVVLAFPFAGRFEVLLILWACAGGCAAVCYCIAIRFLSEDAEPERAFGSKMAFEIAIPAMLLLAIPVIVVPVLGYTGAMVVVAAVLVACALPGIRLPSGPALLSNNDRIHVDGDSKYVWMALVAIAVYFAGATSIWSFLERIGNDAGIGQRSIGLALSIAKVAGVAGALTAHYVGDRYGSRAPHIFALGLMLLSMFVLWSATSPFHYAFGAGVFEYAWTIAAVFQIAHVARMDKTKGLIVLTPAALTLGGVIGPALAGQIITTQGFAGLFAMVSLTTIAATVGIVYLNIRASVDNLGYDNSVTNVGHLSDPPK